MLSVGDGITDNILQENLQDIHYIHCSDSLPLGMLSVGDGITDNILQENLQDTPSLLVDEARDPLHSTPPSQSTNSRLSDTLDVVSQNFTMSLGTSLAQSLASLSTSSHSATLLLRSVFKLF